jgi:hypothetical protein
VSAAAYAVQHKRALRVPAGSYLLKQCISFANAPVALLGDGIGLSILKWSADAASLGISIMSNADTQFHLVRDLSFYVAKKGGTAITLDYTGQVNSVSFPGKKLILDRSSPRFLISDCFFSGSSDPWSTGWDRGVDAIASLKANIVRCSFTGWVTGSAPILGGSACAFRFRGINQTYENGHPVEFYVSNSSIYNTDTGIVFDGVEGGYVKGCQLVGVTRGVHWLDGFGRPAFSVEDCHINTYRECIYVENGSHVNIRGNSLYGVLDSTQITYGVIIRGQLSDSFVIASNTFENTNPNRQYTGITVEQGKYGLIASNVFRTSGIGISTAMWLTSGSSYCRVSADNIYGNKVTTKVVNQGQYNVIAV